MSKKPRTTNEALHQDGPCHICGNTVEPSEDHVPPQAATGKDDVIVDLVYPGFADHYARQQPSIAQGGTKFPWTCRKCNSLLGKYDRTFIDLRDAVHNALEGGIRTPTITVETRPGALCRALLGHILAAKPHFNPAGFDGRVRKYILDGNEELPAGLHVSYWPFPYKLTYINPELVSVVPTRTGPEPAILRLLKFYPVAYLVCDQDPYKDLGTLTPYASMPPQQTVELEIRLTPIQPPNWPEAHSIQIVTAGGANAVYTQPRKRKL